ncbi:hypothetical protein E2C01_012079 [Portunus trituberculatus]|uniref:Uncharacterized protein n=1 Tax=Portunus trituberculatus TaxID=210409 RepID=A0A5B7DCR9_PORTR|nr:hypothetical protein [Portunus trituberculatus]
MGVRACGRDGQSGPEFPEAVGGAGRGEVERRGKRSRGGGMLQRWSTETRPPLVLTCYNGQVTRSGYMCANPKRLPVTGVGRAVGGGSAAAPTAATSPSQECAASGAEFVSHSEKWSCVVIKNYDGITSSIKAMHSSSTALAYRGDVRGSRVPIR